MKKNSLITIIILVVIIVVVLFLLRESQNKAYVTEPGPFIFKTDKDYSLNIPVGTKDNNITSYSSPVIIPGSIDTKDNNLNQQVNYAQYRLPSFKLNQGYIIDVGGLIGGKNTRYLNLTYEEYKSMWEDDNSSISIIENYIISYDSPFLEMYDCKEDKNRPSKNNIEGATEEEIEFYNKYRITKAEVDYFNNLINNDLLNKVCKKVI